VLYFLASKTMNAMHKRFAAILWATLWCCTLFLGPSWSQTTRGADIAVVVNPDTPVNDLSLSEVRRVLLGERQYWNSKLAVVLLIRAPVARERDVVLRVIYQMTEDQFKQYWIAKIFRAEAASPPKIVYSNDMQYELVAAIPGAIAFVDAHNVRPGVKVLRIDGHLPGDRDYPLR
jgi:ABC-type phosphate transport system substrate-binding protein